jgi:cytochrome b6-f complex iron-sulfur subunit
MSAHGRPPQSEGLRPDAIKRRTFLDIVLGVGVVSTALSFVYPLWRYLIPPAAAETSTNSVVAGKVADFKTNSGVIVKFGSKPAIVVRTAEGEFRAFSAICTHLDCTVQFKSDTSQLWCACHNGLYDLGGNNVSGPPPRPLETFSVNLRGEPGQEDVVLTRS